VTTLADVTMHGDFSPEARERALRTILVSDVFADNAENIVAALLHVPADHVLVAVVDEGHGFAGTHHVEESKIVERVPELEEPGGWAMVFSPGTKPEDVVRRAAQMADIAKARLERIDRIIARRAAQTE
jgi:hypothetical protein